MKERRSGKIPGRVILGWIIALGAEGGAAWFGRSLITDTPRGGELALALLLHTLAAAALFAASGTEKSERRSRIRFRYRLYGLLVLFLPIMGPLGCALVHFTMDTLMKPRGLVDDFREETAYRISERQLPDSGRNLNEIINVELEVQPVLDILDGDDDDLKRGAIDTLRRIGTAEAIQILKKSLSDPSIEVRYNAHAAIAKLEEHHAEKIKAAQEAVDLEPQNGERQHQLGRVYLTYAESGLLETDSQSIYLQMAKEALEQAIALNPENADLLVTLGRLSTSLDQFDAGIDYFHQANRKQGDSVTALLGLAQIHYNTGNYTALAESVGRLGKMADTEAGDVRETILTRFWTQPVAGV